MHNILIWFFTIWPKEIQLIRQQQYMFIVVCTYFHNINKIATN